MKKNILQNNKSKGAYALLINLDNKVVLQERTNNFNIENSGKVGMFGGSLEEGEQVLDGLKRELLEELELNLDDCKVRKLNVYLKKNEIDGFRHTANVYVINKVDMKRLKLKEGKGFIIDSPEKLINNKNLTKITKLAIQDLVI